MQQKTLTNKERLMQGVKVITLLVWFVATVWTFSNIMQFSPGALGKWVAGVLLAMNFYAMARKIKKLWDEE